jgi:ribulose-phosphate 3-epimerase
MAQICPSLLAADQTKLADYIKQLEPLCPGFHIDIMDNKFVPNTGISLEKVHHIAQITYKQLWVHLMVEDPEEYIKNLTITQGSIITFHIESHKKTSDTINKILEKKCLPGMAINPKTGVNEIFPFLKDLHQVLIMSVEPGFSGQLFIKETIAKIDPLVGFRNTSGFHFKIALDGGISLDNISAITHKGADQLVIGSAIFNAQVGAAKAYELFAQLAQ